MIWQDPSWLWLLLLLPIGGLLSWYYARYRKKQVLRFFSQPLLSRLSNEHWTLGRRLKITFLTIATSLLILSAAGPKIGTEVREVKRRGVDVIVALDLSLSMKAEDVSPSRLAKAKFEIMRLVDRLKGDRIGLIIFTGEAYLQSPLTTDYSALKLFLNVADTDQMPSSTTNMAPAFRIAKRAFESIEDESNSKAAKVLVIIGDGEDQVSEFDKELQDLVKMGVDVYTVGVGTKAGSTIPIYDPKTGVLRGYKRDNSGRVVTTKLVPDVLQQIARKGNGTYFEIQRGNDNLDGLFQKLDQLEKGEFAKQEYADFKNQYQLFAGLGAFFMILGLLTPTLKPAFLRD